jgi:hypothetical protein
MQVKGSRCFCIWLLISSQFAENVDNFHYICWLCHHEKHHLDFKCIEFLSSEIICFIYHLGRRLSDSWNFVSGTSFKACWDLGDTSSFHEGMFQSKENRYMIDPQKIKHLNIPPPKEKREGSSCGLKYSKGPDTHLLRVIEGGNKQ